MKVYFTASTSKSAKKPINYKPVINYIKTLGHLNTNYVYFPKDSLAYRKAVDILKKTNVYDYQISLINKSDVLIADVTHPSITVGYQIEYAINRKIPTIVIYKKHKNFKLPVVLTHTQFGLLNIEKYSNASEVKNILISCLNDIKKGSIKFNFYLNLQIHNFLTRKSELEHKSKSDIIREILEFEIRKEL